LTHFFGKRTESLESAWWEDYTNDMAQGARKRSGAFRREKEVGRMEGDPNSRKPAKSALFREGSVRPPDPETAGHPR